MNRRQQFYIVLYHATLLWLGTAVIYSLMLVLK